MAALPCRALRALPRTSSSILVRSFHSSSQCLLSRTSSRPAKPRARPMPGLRSTRKASSPSQRSGAPSDQQLFLTREQVEKALPGNGPITMAKMQWDIPQAAEDIRIMLRRFADVPPEERTEEWAKNLIKEFEISYNQLGNVVGTIRDYNSSSEAQILCGMISQAAILAGGNAITITKALHYWRNNANRYSGDTAQVFTKLKNIVAEAKHDWATSEAMVLQARIYQEEKRLVRAYRLLLAVLSPARVNEAMLESPEYYASTVGAIVQLARLFRRSKTPHACRDLLAAVVEEFDDANLVLEYTYTLGDSPEEEALRVELLQRAAMTTNVDAMHELGVIYEQQARRAMTKKGKRFELRATLEGQQAFEWYALAAELGRDESHLTLVDILSKEGKLADAGRIFMTHARKPDGKPLE